MANEKVDPLNALLCIFTSFSYQYPSILCCGIHNENYEQSLGPWRLQKNLKWSQMNYSNLGGQARLMYIGCTQPLFWSGLNWTSLTHQMFCYLCNCINIISTSRMPTSCTKCRDNRKVVNQMRPHKWLINCTCSFAWLIKTDMLKMKDFWKVGSLRGAFEGSINSPWLY